jgi:hypothetical protein
MLPVFTYLSLSEEPCPKAYHALDVRLPWSCLHHLPASFTDGANITDMLTVSTSCLYEAALGAAEF